MKLLSVGVDAKTIKGQEYGYLTGILYLAPYKLSGKNVCPNAHRAQCHIACLNTAGRGAMSPVQTARVNKTNMYFDARQRFLETLDKDIVALKRKAKNQNMIPCVRLNGTSDIRWENHGIIDEHSDLQFYDYTKIANRKPPSNYHLTWSYSNASEQYAKGRPDSLNWAVVFSSTPPSTYLGRSVIDGDKSDLRFLDPTTPNVIVGLTAKGKAKQDKTGFVQHNEND